MNHLVITLAAATASSANYEKMASTFKIISIVLFVLALVCLAFGVFAFIAFKIPTIVGDLTGRNARKSIEQMRKENEKGGKKSYRPHPVASARGTITEPIVVTSREMNQTDRGQPTDVLEDENATEKLNYNETGTEILNGGTEVLSEESIQSALNEKTVKMKMIQNIVLIHTEETI